MTKPLIAPIAGCLSYFTLTLAAFAGPVFDINFSGDTVGQAPTTVFTTPAGETIANPNMLSTPGAFSVAQNYQSGSAILPGHSVVFRVDKPEDGPAVGGSLNIWGNEADFVGNQDYSIKADLVFNGSFGNLGASSLMINIFNPAYNYTGYQTQVYFSDNRVIINTEGGQKIVANQWTADELIALEIRVLYSSNRSEVFINNNFVGDIALDLSNQKGVYGFQFLNADATNSHFEVAIGNIRAEAIPEPHGLAIIALGGAALLASKRVLNSKSAGAK